MRPDPVPHPTTAVAAAPPLRARRRRPLSVGGVARGSVPYLLVAPVVIAIGTILGYPLYHLVTLSFQRYGLPELIQHHGEWIGLDNYRSVLSDHVFWDTLVRTLVFTAVNVTLTMVLGLLIALLLVRLAPVVRIMLMTGLVLVWAMPAVVAVQVWYWMTNFQNGVVNYILTELHVGDFEQHDWYATTFSKLAMVTLLIVWGALPFVAISLYAGLAQVPHELVEAARDRRREPLARVPGHHVPRAQADLLHPHEPVDHLGLRRVHAAVSPDRGVTRGLVELPDGRLRVHRGLLALRLRPRRRDLDPDAADRRRAERRLRPRQGAPGGARVSAVPASASATAPRSRRRRRTWRRVRRSGWNVVGIALFLVLIFPVFWMVSTSFKPDDEVNSGTPTWFSLSPTLQHFRDAMNRPYFWDTVQNSLIVVCVTVVASVAIAFLAAVALAKYRFSGQKAIATDATTVTQTTIRLFCTVSQK